MQLSDFLATVPELTHQQALDAAKAHTVLQGNMLAATTVNGWLSAFKLLPVVKQIAENEPSYPAHSDLLAVWVGLLGDHEFNFKIGNVTGDSQIAALNRLINTDLTEHAPALNMFKDTALYFANTATHPFANATLHDVLIIRNACPTKPVTAVNGWATITITADVPLHNPRLLALNPRTGQWQWAGNFRSVAAAGAYDVQVTSQWLGTELVVDDVYGVIA